MTATAATPPFISQLLREATERLTRAGVASPRADAELLLAHVVAVPRGRLLTLDVVPPEAAARYQAVLARREAREPLQHITGVAPFRHIDLKVGPGVFLPRPETELLAGWAIERARQINSRPPIVVDLCTGSGAIAASIVDEVPGAQVHAVELDPAALEWAVTNLAGRGVDLRGGDMAEAFPDLSGLVDVVVSNPPYIPLSAFEGIDEETRSHDPALALWSGDDGLEAIRVVEEVAARLLRSGGVVGVEHADVQGDSAPAVFRSAGRWRNVVDHRDLAGRPRFLTAELAR